MPFHRTRADIQMHMQSSFHRNVEIFPSTETLKEVNPSLSHSLHIPQQSLTENEKGESPRVKKSSTFIMCVEWNLKKTKKVQKLQRPPKRRKKENQQSSQSISPPMYVSYVHSTPWEKKHVYNEQKEKTDHEKEKSKRQQKRSKYQISRHSLFPSSFPSVKKHPIPISISWSAYSFSPSILHFSFPSRRKYNIHSGQKTSSSHSTVFATLKRLDLPAKEENSHTSRRWAWSSISYCRISLPLKPTGRVFASVIFLPGVILYARRWWHWLVCPFCFSTPSHSVLKIGAHQKGTLEEAINTIHE
jgi:hypothetical protein